MPGRSRGLRRLRGRGRLPRVPTTTRTASSTSTTSARTSPEAKNGFQDEDGCPDNDDLDRDGDGILDDVDKCPDDPEDKDGFEDEDGCPDPDNDKDGILDVDDQCPNEPEDKDGFEDEDGCPDPDNDNDGILDDDDKCPNEPETYNGFEDEDGCPDKGKRHRPTRASSRSSTRSTSRPTRTMIKPVSFPLLDAIAATIKGNPQIQLIEIQGHADERGDDAHNLDLTERRAPRCGVALEQRNVLPSRLKSHGYGETKPICTAAQRGLLEQEPPRRVHHPEAQRRGWAVRRRGPVTGWGARPPAGPPDL